MKLKKKSLSCFDDKRSVSGHCESKHFREEETLTFTI